VAHPVGFHLHHQPETVGGDALEIGGVVLGGEGVVGAAVFLNHAGKLARFHIVGGLEHQVLEEMGDAGAARLLVGGAGAVPDHVHHHRGAVILDHHHLHAVFQPEVGDLAG
jgi:hypothetical protein